MRYTIFILYLLSCSLALNGFNYALPRQVDDLNAEQALCPDEGPAVLPSKQNPNLRYPSGLDFGIYYGRPYYYAPHHYYFPNRPYATEGEERPFAPYHNFYNWQK